MRSVTNDVETLERFLGQSVRDLAFRPSVRDLTGDQYESLVERYGETWAPLAADLVRRNLHTQNTDPATLNEFSYAEAARLKSEDVLWKRAIPELAGQGEATARASTDAELLAIAGAIGIALPAAVDSSRTAVEGVNDSDALNDVVRCVTPSGTGA